MALSDQTSTIELAHRWGVHPLGVLPGHFLDAPPTRTARFVAETITELPAGEALCADLRNDREVATTNPMRLVMLIDSDNATASLTAELLAEIAKYGTPTIKRVYGDWTTQNLVGWKEELLRHAIQPIQQFAYTRGKNSTHSALIIGIRLP